MSCPRSYHLPCAAEAECHFDPKRHIDRLGGLFCPKHVTSADAAHAVGGPAKDWAAALERAMAAVRPESAKRSRTKVGKDEVEDEDDDDDGSGVDDGMDDDDDDDDEPEESEAVRKQKKSLMQAVDAAGLRGCRCPVCAEPFGIEPLTQTLPHDVTGTSLSRALVHATLRQPELEWMAAVALKCDLCGVVGHAACVGASVELTRQVLQFAVTAASGRPWRCQACEYTKKRQLAGQQTAYAASAGAGSTAAADTTDGASAEPQPTAAGGADGPLAATGHGESSLVCALCSVGGNVVPDTSKCPLVPVRARAAGDGVPAADGAAAVSGGHVSGRDAGTTSGPQRWVHVSCALWCPGVVVQDMRNDSSAWILHDDSGEAAKPRGGDAGDEPAVDGTTSDAPQPGAPVRASRSHHAATAAVGTSHDHAAHGSVCAVCGITGGVTQGCSKDSCGKRVHPVCAVGAGWYLEHVKQRDKHVDPRAASVMVYCR